MDNKFKNKLQEEMSKPIINKQDEEEIVTNNDNEKGVINLVKNDPKKQTRQAIPIYLSPETVTQLNKLSKKSGYSRNELVNIFIKYGLENNNIK